MFFGEDIKMILHAVVMCWLVVASNGAIYLGNNPEIKDIQNGLQTIQTDLKNLTGTINGLEKRYLSQLEPRMANMARLLTNLDSSVKNIEERSNVWSSFQQLSSAWNEPLDNKEESTKTVGGHIVKFADALNKLIEKVEKLEERDQIGHGLLLTIKNLEKKIDGQNVQVIDEDQHQVRHPIKHLQKQLRQVLQGVENIQNDPNVKRDVMIVNPAQVTEQKFGKLRRKQQDFTFLLRSIKSGVDDLHDDLLKFNKDHEDELDDIEKTVEDIEDKLKILIKDDKRDDKHLKTFFNKQNDFIKNVIEKYAKKTVSNIKQHIDDDSDDDDTAERKSRKKHRKDDSDDDDDTREKKSRRKHHNNHSDDDDDDDDDDTDEDNDTKERKSRRKHHKDDSDDDDDDDTDEDDDDDDDTKERKSRRKHRKDDSVDDDDTKERKSRRKHRKDDSDDDDDDDDDTKERKSRRKHRKDDSDDDDDDDDTDEDDDDTKERKSRRRHDKNHSDDDDDDTDEDTKERKSKRKHRKNDSDDDDDDDNTKERKTRRRHHKEDDSDEDETRERRSRRKHRKDDDDDSDEDRTKERKSKKRHYTNDSDDDDDSGEKKSKRKHDSDDDSQENNSLQHKKASEEVGESENDTDGQKTKIGQDVVDNQIDHTEPVETPKGSFLNMFTKHMNPKFNMIHVEGSKEMLGQDQDESNMLQADDNYRRDED